MQRKVEVTSREDAGADLQALESKLQAGINEMFEHAHSGVYPGKTLMLANHTALLLSDMKTYFETVAGAIDMMLRHDLGMIQFVEEGEDEPSN